MYKKVMWATDGSEIADRALPHAKTLAADGGGPLTVVYCEEFTLPGKGGGSLPVHANEGDIQAKIERQVAELSNDGPGATLHTTRSKVGGAAHAIAEIADQEHSDVIVVGTRGRSAIAGLLLGSVTERLLHIAPCPVLAVPPDNASGG
ncbi:MAG TPA: universal stress protein [Solirubrobacteraceae bacterium]|nr:universal stress protein [Solirubrobacteraceae bacterium]